MKTNFNLELVAEARLKLQTVQRHFLEYFDILSPSVDQFKTRHFLSNFINWNKERQDKFLIELGGPMNLKRSWYWINNLIKENKLKRKENNEAPSPISN